MPDEVMEMIRPHPFWLTAPRDAVNYAIREAIAFKIAEENWEVEL